MTGYRPWCSAGSSASSCEASHTCRGARHQTGLQISKRSLLGMFAHLHQDKILLPQRYLYNIFMYRQCTKRNRTMHDLKQSPIMGPAKAKAVSKAKLLGMYGTECCLEQMPEEPKPACSSGVPQRKGCTCRSSMRIECTKA